MKDQEQLRNINLTLQQILNEMKNIHNTLNNLQRNSSVIADRIDRIEAKFSPF